MSEKKFDYLWGLIDSMKSEPCKSPFDERVIDAFEEVICLLRDIEKISK